MRQPHDGRRKKRTGRTYEPGVLEAAGLLAARGLDVEAARGPVVGAPHRAALLLARLAVDGLPVAPVLRAVPVEDVHHVLQPVPRAEPFGSVRFSSVRFDYRGSGAESARVGGGASRRRRVSWGGGDRREERKLLRP